VYLVCWQSNKVSERVWLAMLQAWFRVNICTYWYFCFKCLSLLKYAMPVFMKYCYYSSNCHYYYFN
jgi:hypothetical protein